MLTTIECGYSARQLAVERGELRIAISIMLIEQAQCFAHDFAG